MAQNPSGCWIKRPDSINAGKNVEILSSKLMKNALNSSATVSLLKKTVPPMDKFLMRYSRGWINTGMQSVAMVTTKGDKSGQAREMVTL